MKKYSFLLILSSFSLLNAATPKIPREVLVKKCDEAVNKFKQLKNNQEEQQSEECINASIEARAFLTYLHSVDQYAVNPAFFRLIHNYLETRCVLIDEALSNNEINEEALSELRTSCFAEIEKIDKEAFQEVIEYRKKENHNNEAN